MGRSTAPFGGEAASQVGAPPGDRGRGLTKQSPPSPPKSAGGRHRDSHAGRLYRRITYLIGMNARPDRPAV